MAENKGEKIKGKLTCKNEFLSEQISESADLID